MPSARAIPVPHDVDAGAAAIVDAPSTPVAASLEGRAREALLIRLPGREPDLVLADRAVRLLRLVDHLILQPELGAAACDRRAVEAAALFVEIGPARAIEAGQLNPRSALLEPYDDRWREDCVDALRDAGRDLLPWATFDAAVTALRQWGRGAGVSAESLLLTEAVRLDDLGPLWIWRQALHTSDQPGGLTAFLSQWRVRREYGYWESRINDLRFNWSRQLARRRVAAMQVFVESLEGQTTGIA